MSVTSGWTGGTACSLQTALRMSNEAFAEHLGIGTRTIAGWRNKPSTRPQPEMQQLLDTALERASSAARARFASLAEQETGWAAAENAPTEGEDEPRQSPEAERRLAMDTNVSAALDWLDEHADWSAGQSRREVASRLAHLDVRKLQERASERSRVDRSRVARALAEYYGERAREAGRYCARIGSDTEIETSMVTSAEWLDLVCPLVARHDRLAVTRTTAGASNIRLDRDGAQRAAQRIAETLAMGTRLVDMPLYRLLDVDVTSGSISGTVGISRFIEYAVTMDLLEGELIDALATGTAGGPGSMPLRDRYLPGLNSVVDTSHRLCAGGPLALCAIARPADPFRGEADYVLLVQERSGNVLNAARRLAVIPKGFHQPMTDFRADAQLGATLRREMDEELFGRDDIDNTVSEQRAADPMHPSRLSAPMQWLVDEPSRLRMECTAFGINLLSGNYEFPGLIVIEDEEFWRQFGGRIEANWEAAGLRQYSSLDDELLTELIGDVAWSNEGLFALLQGLRRLGEVGGERVKLPSIAWEVR